MWYRQNNRDGVHHRGQDPRKGVGPRRERKTLRGQAPWRGQDPNGGWAPGSVSGQGRRRDTNGGRAPKKGLGPKRGWVLTGTGSSKRTGPHRDSSLHGGSTSEKWYWKTSHTCLHHRSPLPLCCSWAHCHEPGKIPVPPSNFLYAQRCTDN